MTIVVAAVMERDGNILIGQRKLGDTHPLKWEFPGGKVERGESPQAALSRELREELDIDAVVGPEITRYEARYPGRSPFVLIFYEVSEFRGEPRNIVFEQILWEPRHRLHEFDFLEADIEFVHRLSGQSA